MGRDIFTSFQSCHPSQELKSWRTHTFWQNRGVSERFSRAGKLEGKVGVRSRFPISVPTPSPESWWSRRALRRVKAPAHDMSQIRKQNKIVQAQMGSHYLKEKEMMLYQQWLSRKMPFCECCLVLGAAVSLSRLIHPLFILWPTSP